MDILNKRLKKIKKKTRELLLCTIIFLILSILCFGWVYFTSKTYEGIGITLNKLISEGSTKEKINVELTVTEVPFVFAEYDNMITSPKYYFLMNEDYLSIGYLDYTTYKKLDKEDINEKPITITGLTKKIPDDVIELAIEVYNENLGEEFLTKDNYKNYIGEICIDTTGELVDNLFQVILGFAFTLVGFVFIIIYFYRCFQIKKTIKNTDVWDKVKTELEKETVIEYSKIGLLLTDNYIVDGLKGLTIIPYQDIIWIYLHEQKYNGITGNRYLVVITLDKKKKKIAGLEGFHPKSKNLYIEIMSKIYEKNKKVLIGFTKENKKEMKDLYQIK